MLGYHCGAGRLLAGTQIGMRRRPGFNTSGEEDDDRGGLREPHGEYPQG